jgi:(p)ppGpp synthase/HD superfamily hydrolase
MGQVDKGGSPFILHPLRVMFGVKGTEAQIAAVLHDVLEDTPVTVDELRQQGFSEPVFTAVVALTKIEGEEYMAFVARAAQDPIARQVKLADLRENSDISRIPHPTEKDFKRKEKFSRAMKLIGWIEAGNSAGSYAKGMGEGV